MSCRGIWSVFSSEGDGGWRSSSIPQDAPALFGDSFVSWGALSEMIGLMQMTYHLYQTVAWSVRVQLTRRSLGWNIVWHENQLLSLVSQYFENYFTLDLKQMIYNIVKRLCFARIKPLVVLSLMCSWLNAISGKYEVFTVPHLFRASPCGIHGVHAESTQTPSILAWTPQTGFCSDWDGLPNYN